MATNSQTITHRIKMEDLPKDQSLKTSKIEEQLGIKTYLSKHTGFTAIFKKRYSDFIVHEVDTNGTIAILKKNEAKDIKEETKDGSDEIKEAQEKLSKILSKEVASEVMDIIQNPTKEKHTFTFPKGTKDERRLQHELIRENSFISKLAIADSIDSCVRIWSREYYTNKKSNNYKSNASNSKWPRDRPNFAKFILYKENLDTSTACKDICKLLNLNKKTKIECAGMKDKRGITTQFCTIYRKSEEELIGVNEKFMNKYNGTSNCALRIGGVEYVKDSLKLGALSGNRFDIALRNIQAQGNILEITKEAVSSFQSNGFINYFGTQRFGKHNDTYLMGIQVLKHNFQNVIDTILNPKSAYQEKYDNVVNARIKWKSRFDALKEDTKAERMKIEQEVAKEIISNFGRFMISEYGILQSIIRNPCDYQAAFLNIPRGTKLMFVHAVQSYVWNTLATKRAEMGNNVIIGDLVLVEDKGKEDGGGGTSGLLGKVVEYVTQENVDKYAITDVVLPLVGTKVLYPKYNESSFPTIEQVLNDSCSGLKTEDFDQKHIRELKLGGDYRKFIVIPKDVQYQLKSYENDTQNLLETDVMKINNQALDSSLKVINNDSGIGSKKLAVTIGFTLPPSSYATIAMRELMKCPTDSDFQILLEEEDIIDQEDKKEDKDSRKRKMDDSDNMNDDSKKNKVDE